MATQASDSIRQKPRMAPADELAVIVQRAQSFTGASGAAIAISEGNSDEIVCRARSGSSAPDVGTALRVEGSFTGICIQTGKELRCDDAETDTRVDTTAIRALGIRSMVVTPIRDEGKVVGVLAIFAPMPHAFTITHVAVLKTMSDQISTLLQKERRAKDEPHFEPPSPPPVPVAVPKPPVSVVVPKPPVAAVAPKPPVAVPLPPPVVIKPATPSPAAAAPALAPLPTPTPVRASVANAPHIETEAVSLAADISAPAPFSKREEKREYRPEPSPATRTSFGTLDAVAGEPERSSAGKLIILGVVAALAIAAGAAWFFVGKKSPSSSAQSQSAPQQNAAPAAAAATTNPPATAGSATSSSAPAVPSNATASSATASSSAKAGSAEKSDSKKNEPRKKEAAQSPEPAPTPATVSLAGGPSKIARSAPVDQSPDVSPSLAVGGSSAGRLASITGPVNSSAPSMLAQSDLVNAKAIRAVPAAYPELAKARRISGTVIVRVTVGKDGKTKNPVFVSGPVIFRDAAFDAVKQWLFKPAELNGQTIEQETDIRVKFTPN